MTQGGSEVRFLRLRADTLMGLFRHLPEPPRAQALVALVRSIAEHGGDSVRRYLQASGGDVTALLAMIENSASGFLYGFQDLGFRFRAAAGCAEAQPPQPQTICSSGSPDRNSSRMMGKDRPSILCRRITHQIGGSKAYDRGGANRHGRKVRLVVDLMCPWPK